MPENVPYAREVLNAPPTNPTPATDYFIRQPDGRIEHWISDLAAPHTLRPVSFNVAVTGAPPPTDVTRSGGAAGVTLSNVSYVEQAVRPTVNIPLTALVLENATAAGAGPVALAVLDVAAQEWLGAGTAAVSGSGLQAPVNLTLLAGREYRIRAGNLGSGVNGTTYDGYLASVTLGSGYAWTGLSTTGSVAYWDGTYKTVPDATQQLPLQFVTGDMSGFDPSGLTIRGTDPVQVTYDAEARTYTVGLASGADETDSLPDDGNIAHTGYGVNSGPQFLMHTSGTLLSSTQSWKDLTGLQLQKNGVVIQTWPSLPAGDQVHVLTLTTPLTYATGDVLHWVVLSTPNPQGAHPLGGTTPTPFSLNSVDGTFTWTNPTGTGWKCTLVSAGSGLDVGDVGGLSETLAGHEQRLTALEARPTLSAEYVQDVVGAMIPGATYDDAAGTITLPAGSSADPETIRDLVAAFAVAGTGVTITHNDAADTLTISASATPAGIFRGAWAASTVYAANDVVIQGGAAYYAKTAFTSGASFNAANWNAWPDQVGSGGGGGVTVSATAPSSPAQGQQWYDTSRNYLLTYVGTVWRDAMGTDRTPISGFSRYRVRITARQDGGESINLTELVLRSTTGGPQIATGGTASANGNDPSYPPANAFNGNTTDGGWLSNSLPAILQYTFPSPVTLAEYGIGVGYALQRPRSWVFEGSNDGTTWTALSTVTDWTTPVTNFTVYPFTL